MKVIGHITRRRCIGKMLAFADIQIQDVKDAPAANKFDCCPEPGEIVQVVYHRRSKNESTTSIVWDEGLPGNQFPEKNTALPYGALVVVSVCSNSMELRNGRKNYIVRSWELLQNPREEAIDDARTSGEGISCSKYLKSRGESFLKFNPQAAHYWGKPKTKGRRW